MPTYQYRCTACGHDLEAVQKFSDAALTECPHCGGSLRKIYNAVGVVFKGSGFYRTDSRANGRDGDSGGSATPKTESAPAAKSGDSGSDQGSKATPAPAAAASSTGSAGSSS